MLLNIVRKSKLFINIDKDLKIRVRPDKNNNAYLAWEEKFDIFHFQKYSI